MNFEGRKIRVYAKDILIKLRTVPFCKSRMSEVQTMSDVHLYYFFNHVTYPRSGFHIIYTYTHQFSPFDISTSYYNHSGAR